MDPNKFALPSRFGQLYFSFFIIKLPHVSQVIARVCKSWYNLARNSENFANFGFFLLSFRGLGLVLVLEHTKLWSKHVSNIGSKQSSNISDSRRLLLLRVKISYEHISIHSRLQPRLASMNTAIEALDHQGFQRDDARKSRFFWVLCYESRWVKTVSITGPTIGPTTVKPNRLTGANRIRTGICDGMFQCQL